MSDKNNTKYNKANTGIINFDSVYSSVFYKEEDALLFKKTERITRAAHLITRHMPQTEPVRKDVRKKAIESFFAMSAALRQDTTQAVEGVRLSFLELVAMLTVARDVGDISEENYTLMCQACGECVRALVSRRGKGSHTDIKTLLEDVSVAAESDSVRDIFVGAENTTGSSTVNQKDTKVIEKDTSSSSTKKQNAGLNKEDRKAIIKSIIAREKKVSIKDISTVIVDCSEKTLQRDINELVDDGVLNKEGKRRWSRYTLAG